MSILSIFLGFFRGKWPLVITGTYRGVLKGEWLFYYTIYIDIYIYIYIYKRVMISRGYTL